MPVKSEAGEHDPEVHEALAEARAREAEAWRRLAGAEARLDSAERRVAELDAVLDAMPHAVYIGDADGIWRANAEALRMLGASSLADLNENIGTLGAKFRVRRERDGPLVPPEELPFARSLAGTPAHLDTWATRLDTGEDVFIGGHSAPVRIDGRTIGAVAVNVDLTHRVLIEQQLRLADRRKDDFLAMLAHELRNPLAPIRNAAHILRLEPSDREHVRQAAAIIARQVEHMTDLVDDLLDVSRVTRGLVALDKQVVDLREIVVAAVEQTAALVQWRRHHLEVAGADEAAFVCGDRTRLVQIVTNLLTNAAKFTPDGGRIVIEVGGDRHRASVTVADNGHGIRPELLPHVFEPFTQEQRSADRAQGGLGLGLALVRSLVELHDGTVTASSPGADRGAEFTVTLARFDQNGAGAAGREAHADHTAPGGTLDILIVDDNADAAESLAIVLREQGHRVRVAHEARSALAHAAAAPPRVVLLDIGLPDMDGLELARRLRSLKSTRGALLVALTGYGQAGDRERSQAAGFDFHLVKPADPSRIAALIADLA
jgi:signal transduction histidine kinase